PPCERPSVGRLDPPRPSKENENIENKCSGLLPRFLINKFAFWWTAEPMLTCSPRWEWSCGSCALRFFSAAADTRLGFEQTPIHGCHPLFSTERVEPISSPTLEPWLPRLGEDPSGQPRTAT